MWEEMDFDSVSSYDGVRKLYYSVSVRTNGNRNIWGLVTNGEMNLSAYGKIVEADIGIIDGIYEGLAVERSIVMPNHVHFIISLARAGLKYTPTEDEAKEFLTDVLDEYKKKTTKDIVEFITNGAERGIPAESDTDFWHKGCHVRSIRSNVDYKKAVRHIKHNPREWELDRYYA